MCVLTGQHRSLTTFSVSCVCVCTVWYCILHLYVQDTPEYFWEDDAWEPAYQALCAYLDIPLRVGNLNKRLVRLGRRGGGGGGGGE